MEKPVKLCCRGCGRTLGLDPSGNITQQARDEGWVVTTSTVRCPYCHKDQSLRLLQPVPGAPVDVELVDDTPPTEADDEDTETITDEELSAMDKQEEAGKSWPDSRPYGYRVKDLDEVHQVLQSPLVLPSSCHTGPFSGVQKTQDQAKEDRHREAYGGSTPSSPKKPPTDDDYPTHRQDAIKEVAKAFGTATVPPVDPDPDDPQAEPVNIYLPGLEDPPQPEAKAPFTPSWKTQQVGGNHYRSLPIQPLEFIVKNGLSFCEGCVVKYVTRHRTKNGADDIRKAIHYLQVILEEVYGEGR